MPRSASSSSTSRPDRPYLRYQRTASESTSGGNRKPVHTEGGLDEVTTPVSRPRDRSTQHRLRANAYATSKAALEAHTLNLAAELAGTGVTVNVFRPGAVDTAMQAFIRGQDPEQIGAVLHQRFVRNHEQGILLSPAESAAALLSRLAGEDTGQIWDAGDLLLTGDRR